MWAGPGRASPVTPTADGVRVAVRVTPRASRNAIQGLAQEADGTSVVRVMVTAVPEGGRANTALIKLLARAWGVPKSAVSVVAGATDRRKVLHVAGPSGDLIQRLNHWIGGLAGAG